MIRKFLDPKYNFIELFNTETGAYIRTGIIENNKDTGIDSFLRSYPSLIDIGIMGNCEHGKLGLCVASGVQCYQQGLTKALPNMSLNNFKRIIDESKDKIFQVALGGRGDVDCHENFEEILAYCAINNIVPNFTTSGLRLTEEKCKIIKEYCGAVAISWYRQSHTIKALKMLIDAGIKTNIHYVLGEFSVDEAIWQLDSLLYPEKIDNSNKNYVLFPNGINAVLFLSHKPVGQGSKANILLAEDPRAKRFYELVDNMKSFPFKVGFDSCSIPGILNNCKNVNLDSVDYCEGARYSMYISADMKALPCSFDQNEKWAYELGTIQEAWDSQDFNNFRKFLMESCQTCRDRVMCGGGCPIVPEITLCNRPEKDQLK